MESNFSANLMSRLNKIGIENPWQLIMNLPVSYSDFTVPVINIGSIKKRPNRSSFYAKLIFESLESDAELNKAKQARGESVSASSVPYVKVGLSDGLKTEKCLVFGNVRPWAALFKTHKGKAIHLSGKVKQKDQFINLSDIDIVGQTDQGRIVANYSGKESVISPAKVADCVKIALVSHIGEAVDNITEMLNEDEASIISTCRLPFHSLKHLLTTLHLPKTQDDLEKAMLSARRLTAYYGIRKAMNATERADSPTSRIEINRDRIRELVEQHPFTPTGDQRKAIWDIIQDLSRIKPMDRLLSADVGNGKTLAYGIPAAYACSLGKNVVVLLPTEPLAGQVADNIQTWYPQIKVHLATAGFKGEVKQGEMLVGTTAILPWLKNNADWKVDFAITDEQQKMGTAQREALSSLGTHVLEATATPIPRTMAQTLFGTKKVSIINDCPVEKVINTKLIGNSIEERRQAMGVLNGWIEQGRRVAVIYPLVAEQQAYYYHLQADSNKEAEGIANMMRKAGVTVKRVVRPDEISDVLGEMDDDAKEGFVIELYAEELSHTRLQKRLARYVGEASEALRYIGTRMDEELSAKNKKTIIQGASKWEKLRPGRVAMIHGRSKRQEKVDIIKHMNSGGADILLSTTLIEIGVDVKDLNALMVVGAEKLGAFTLHQLRGRIARNGGTGDFMMMSTSPVDELEDTARDRLNLLVKFNKGDDIAMYDMEQRGFGDLALGGKTQKGFEDGLFPQLKLSPSELEAFLREMAKDIQQVNQKREESVPTP